MRGFHWGLLLMYFLLIWISPCCYWNFLIRSYEVTTHLRHHYYNSCNRFYTVGYQYSCNNFGNSGVIGFGYLLFRLLFQPKWMSKNKTEWKSEVHWTRFSFSIYVQFVPRDKLYRVWVCTTAAPERFGSRSKVLNTTWYPCVICINMQYRILINGSDIIYQLLVRELDTYKN